MKKYKIGKLSKIKKFSKEKRLLKQPKGYFGRRKNVHTVVKNVVEKGCVYTVTERTKKEHSYTYGFKELMCSARITRNVLFSING